MRLGKRDSSGLSPNFFGMLSRCSKLTEEDREEVCLEGNSQKAALFARSLSLHPSLPLLSLLSPQLSTMEQVARTSYEPALKLTAFLFIQPGILRGFELPAFLPTLYPVQVNSALIRYSRIPLVVVRFGSILGPPSSLVFEYE